VEQGLTHRGWICALTITALPLGVLALEPQTLAFVLPLALLIAPLLAGRYPGEGRLARARAATAPLRHAGATSVGCGRVRDVPRGGRLIGYALAVRPPPLS
jgi:hypothetical protein